MALLAGASHRRTVAAAAARPPFYVGVDVGGTNVKLCVVDDLGQPLSWGSIPTEVPQGPDKAVGRMAAAVLEAVTAAGVERSAIAGVGLGVPGGLDREKGLLVAPVNLPGWWDFPLRDRLAAGCGLAVRHFNDGAAAGYGEYWVGAARDYRSMVLFTLGTGVGGAIIVGDVLVEGEHGTGAELGHTIIDYNESARLCPCGQRGHLEAYAGATAVIRRTEEALSAGRPSSLQERVRSGAALNPLVLADEAERGDELALEIVLETARFVGIAVVNALHSIDPDGVILGGAMTFGGDETALGRQFLARIKQEVGQRAFAELVGRTSIEFASLGGDAGCIGAAGLARLAARTNV